MSFCMGCVGDRIERSDAGGARALGRYLVRLSHIEFVAVRIVERPITIVRPARVTPEFNRWLTPGDLALERLHRSIYVVDLEGERIDTRHTPIAWTRRRMLAEVRLEHIESKVTEID